MTSILILVTIGGCINNVASASRQLWSFARDEGLPFSKFLAHVGFPHDHDDMVNHLLTNTGHPRLGFTSQCRCHFVHHRGSSFTD